MRMRISEEFFDANCREANMLLLNKAIYFSQMCVHSLLEVLKTVQNENLMTLTSYKN